MDFLLEEKERLMKLSGELKLIALVRVYLEFYQIPHKKMSVDLGIPQSRLSKVLCGNRDMISDELWYGTLINLINNVNFNKMFLDMFDVYNVDEGIKSKVSEIDEQVNRFREFSEKLDKLYRHTE